jgi:hypothetical protein
LIGVFKNNLNNFGSLFIATFPLGGKHLQGNAEQGNPTSVHNNFIAASPPFEMGSRIFAAVIYR